MKRTLFLLIIILTFGEKSSAQSELPNSTINIGVGAGANYGILGTKAVLGYKNSGLLVGLGFIPGTDGLIGYEIGAQVSSGAGYINVGYGVIGSEQITGGRWKTIKAGNFMLGGMISLGRSKRLFIDLGIGHTFGAQSTRILGETISNNGPVFAAGLGLRLRNKKT